MTDKSAESKETERRLKALKLMLSEVYIPAMETKKEIVHHMNKFAGSIDTSLLQAYGQVQIPVPEIPEHLSSEEIIRDENLMKQLQAAVVSTVCHANCGGLPFEEGPHLAPLKNFKLTGFVCSSNGPRPSKRRWKTKKRTRRTVTTSRLPARRSSGRTERPATTCCLSSWKTMRSVTLSR